MTHTDADTGKIIDLAAFRAERELKAEEPEVELCAITIQNSGRVTLWLSYDLETKEQFNWLIAKIAEVTGAVVDVKHNGFST